LPVVAGVIIATGVSNFHLQSFWICACLCSQWVWRN
jgi:hypothetical protein